MPPACKKTVRRIGGIPMSDPKYAPLLLKNHLCFPLYACSKEVIRLYRPYLEPFDLTYTQYLAMVVIWEESSFFAFSAASFNL